MNVTTKFNVGDTVYTIDADTLKIKEFEIGSISTSTDAEKTTVYLYPKESSNYSSIREDKCFASRDTLIEHVTK